MEERAELERRRTIVSENRAKPGYISGTKFKINSKFPELPYQILK